MSGYLQNGTIYGATLTNDRFGNPNSAYHFDGNDKIEIIPTSHLMPTTFPVTISAWVKFTANPNPMAVFCTDNDNGNDYGYWTNFGIYTNSAMNAAINFGNGGLCISSSRRTKVGNSAVNNGQWHLLTFVVRGPVDMDVYVDCQNDGGSYSGSGGNITYAAFNHLSKIGHFNCSGLDYYFIGEIDEVRFYNRSLSASDVIALYNYPTPVNGNQIVGILGNDTTICPGQNLTLNATMPWATSYAWSNGSSSPTLNVNSAGTYYVSVSGGLCGQGGNDTIVVSTGNSSVNLFPDTVVCKNQTLILDAGINALSYSWNTGATTQSISTNLGGMFIVQAQLAGGCTLIDTINVTGLTTNIPYSQFTYNFTSGGGVQINNTSLYSTSYSCFFSNGGTDTTKNPQYNFPCNLPVTVTLICYGRCGSDTTQQIITNLCDGITDISQILDLKVFPQPASATLGIQYELPSPQISHILLYNVLGQLVYKESVGLEVGKIEREIDVERWASGTYFLQIISNLNTTRKKILIQK